MILLLLLFTIPAIGSGTDSLVKLVAVGDVMLGSWAEELIREHGWDYPTKNLDTVLSDADLVCANLEAPFGTGGKQVEKSYTFQVSPDLVQVLKAGHINVVSLANNHIMDYGIDVMKQTMGILQEHGILYSGAGMTLQSAREPATIQTNGKSIGFASYSLTFPESFWATDTSAGTCFPHHSFFYHDIKKFKQKHDILVVSFHWGGELLSHPKDYQVKLAHRTLDAGADLILGHHPHVVQGIEIYRGKVIVYSLGNYIFGSYSENVKKSMLLKFFFGTNGIEKCKIYPLSVYNKEVDFQPRLLNDQDKINFFNQLQTLSLELNNHANVISGDGWLIIN